ncbi:MAG: hypothetical protein G01um101431_527, partial [Parcubacteria group bacterium Gr01-1014_31]
MPDANTLGQNGAWQQIATNVLAPTNTSAGIIVNASSTFGTSLRIDGSVTSTGRFVLGTTQPQGPGGAGDLWLSGRATSTGLAVTGLSGCDTLDTLTDGTLICGTDANTLGQNGAWQAVATNVLSPTNTSAGIIVNASSTFGTSLRIDGSVTSTGRFVIGTSQPTGPNFGNGDLFVGGSATVTASLDLPSFTGCTALETNAAGALTCGTDEVGAPLGVNGSWQSVFVNTALSPTNTALGFYVNASSTVAGGFRVDGNATTTGRLYLGTSQPTGNFGNGDLFIQNGATSTALAVTGLSTCTAVETNGLGTLICGTDQNTLGQNGAWQSVFANTALSPTNTALGFYVNASSTVAGNFRVDGNSTTTLNLTAVNGLAVGTAQPRSTSTVVLQDTWGFGDSTTSGLFIAAPTSTLYASGLGPNSAYYGVYVQDNPQIASTTYALYSTGGHITQTAGQVKHKAKISDDAVTALGGVGYGIAIQGRFAYVTAYSEGGVEVLDISSPTGTPVHVGSITDSGSSELSGAVGIAVQGNYAYIAADTDDGVEILDISDPTRPRHVGSITDDATTELDGAWNIVVQGRYAYVTARVDDGVEILDISDPANPRHVGAITDAGATELNGARGIVVQGRYAYVTGFDDNGVEVIDVADPANPKHVGAIGTGIPLLTGAASIAIQGKYAYVAGFNSSGIEILDISDPTNPRHAGKISDTADTWLSDPTAIVVQGNYAYISSSASNGTDDGIEILDISVPTNPQHVAAVVDDGVNLLRGANSLAIQGHTMYVPAFTESGLEVLDISGIEAPAATIGALAVSTLDVWQAAQIAGGLSVGSGLNVSGATLLSGAFSVGSSTAGLLHVDPINDGVFIATSTAQQTLTTWASQALVVGGNTYLDGNATTTGSLVLGAALANDDDYLFFDDGWSEALWWDDSPGQFQLTDNLIMNGRATVTSYFVVGTTNPAGVMGTGDVFIGDSATVTASLGLPAFTGCTALETNAAGALTCGTDEVGAPLGVNGAWQSVFANTALAPTNTSLGFFVNASSTVAGGFRVDGNATTTGRLYLGTSQPTGNFGNGDLFVQNGVTSTAFALTTLTGCTAVETNGLGTLICGTDANTLGQNGAWQAIATNVLAPTNTSAGIIVNASSTFGTSLRVDGAVTTTGRFVIGTTQPTGNVGAGDLFVGGDATTTGNLAIGTSAANDDDYLFFDGTSFEALWWDDSPGQFQLTDNFLINGRATTTGNLDIGTGSSYASTTNLVLGGDGGNLGTYNDLYVNSGSLFFNAVNLSQGAVDPGAWQAIATNVLAPTNTSAGIIVNASSTFGTSLRIDGSVTTTGRFVIGTTQPSGEFSAGDLFVGGDASTTGSLSLGTSAANDDDYLYFDSTSFEALWWDDSPGQFQLTDNFLVNGNATTTLNLTVQGFSAFGTAQPRSTSTITLQNTWAFGDSTTSGLFIAAPTSTVYASGLGPKSTYYGVYVQDNPQIASTTYALYAAGGHIAQTAGQLRYKGSLTDDGVTQMAGAIGVAVQGHYAYVTASTGGGVEVLDISSATGTPVHVGQITDSASTLLDNPQSIVVQGRYAYVVGALNGQAESGLQILDISDPTQPRAVGSLADDSTTVLNGAYGITVSGRYAYISSFSDGGIQIVDISDPANPRAVGSSTASGAGTQSPVLVQGRYLYVTVYSGNKVVVFDVIDPGNPKQVGSITDGASTLLVGAQEIVVEGKYAYVTAYTDDALEILDISNPTNPRHAGSIGDTADRALDGASGIVVRGKYAYVTAYSENGVEILDISDPTNPRHVAAFFDDNVSPLTVPYGIAVQGKSAYAASVTSGSLTAFDISGIEAPAATIGALAVSGLEVWQDANIAGHLLVADGLNINGPTLLSGAFSVGSSTASLFHVDPINDGVFIATSTAQQTLTTWASRALVVGGDTQIWGNATTTGSLVLGSALSTDDDYLFFDNGWTEALWWDDSPGQFQLTDNLLINGRATTTGNLEIGTGSSYASTTNLVLGNDGADLGTYNDLRVNGGSLFFNGLNLSQGAFQPGAWQSAFANTALAPTNTALGFFVNASSTVAGGFRVDGNATTSGRLYLGTSQPSGNFGNGDLFVQNGVTTTALAISGYSGSQRCLEVNANGTVIVSTAACGTGAPGQNGAWQAIATNVLAPTNTSAGIIVNASSTFRSLTMDGNATTTGKFLIGITQPSEEFGVGDLFVGGQATVTSAFAVAGLNGCTAIETNGLGTLICGTDDVSAGSLTPGSWHAFSADVLTPTNTSAGIIVNASSTFGTSLRIDGSVTSTGRFVIGTTQPTGPGGAGDLWLSGRATSTGLALTGLSGCDTLDTLTDGTLVCGADANTLGQNGAWQQIATNVLAPTNTSAGIIVNA